VRLSIACALATLSGFVALSYEILWIRTYSFLSWGRAQAFGLVLGSYLAGLALGAYFARRYCGRAERRELRVLALFLLAANLLGYLLVPFAAEMARYVALYWMLPAVGGVAALLGTGFPLIAHFGIPPEPGAGARLSYLYLGNILGSAAGSLLTGFVFMDLWPLRTISVLLALLGLAMCAGVALLGDWPPRRRLALLVALVMGAAAVVASAPTIFAGVYEKLLHKEAYRPGHRFLKVIENRSGVILVDRDGTVYGDGVYDGMFNTDPTRDANAIVRAYALAALHEAPNEVLVIGLGSGSWAQVIAHHPAVERLTVVEINPGYVELLAFSPVVASLRENPRVEFIIDDGRRWLARTDRRFDAIVQNTSYHWRSHTTNLLSREYLELCRAHLKEGGLMLYNTTWSREAQRTGLEAFVHAWLFRNCMIVSDAPLVLDRKRWRRVLAGYVIDGRPVFGGNEQGLDRVAADPAWVDRATLLERTAGAAVITDDNMACEWG
jgi:predicted membrane-bound spermidine synthase